MCVFNNHFGMLSNYGQIPTLIVNTIFDLFMKVNEVNA